VAIAETAVQLVHGIMNYWTTAVTESANCYVNLSTREDLRAAIFSAGQTVNVESMHAHREKTSGGQSRLSMKEFPNISVDFEKLRPARSDHPEIAATHTDTLLKPSCMDGRFILRLEQLTVLCKSVPRVSIPV
jgi:hypothetical protein